MTPNSGSKEGEPTGEQTLPTEERGSQRVSSIGRLVRLLKDSAGFTIPLSIGVTLALPTEIFLMRQLNDVPALGKTWVLIIGVAVTLVPLWIKENLLSNHPTDHHHE